ncbi:putative methyltransferase NSUN7 [Paralichthys olivaceus]|uniref:putative methyltransferase NSUN7 n=1 Tax=Paralichthys olivaceus TaxID=8255 RepID=UPI003753A7E6
MSSVVPSRRIVNDKVGSSEDVISSSVTEQISHQDPDKQTNKETLSFLLPLPHLQSSLPSPVSPPSDQAYLQASAIFQQLREEKPVPLQPLRYGEKTDTPLPESGDKPTLRRAYQLAFNTLKYQDLLEDIITDSCFHTSQQISADLLPLVMVMLFDFQDRKFMLREQTTKEQEEPLQEVRELERSLYKRKTKLAASLARCRVKLNLQSVSCFLSDSVRTKQHRAKCLPLYAWVNTLKTSVEEVCEALLVAGLCEGENTADLKDLAFCRDSLCPDTLVFSRQLLALLQHSSLTAAHALNIQDRSVCVAVSVLRPLLFDNGDVLVVGSFSAVTVAHIAVVASARSGQVLVCGANHTSSQVEEIQGLLRDMDIKNVRILSEAFCGLNEWDNTVQRLKVIIVLPQCSSSALNDPVPTIHSEYGNWDLLSDLSHGSVAQRKIHMMAAQQVRLLVHALTFPKVQTVVYCTRSVYPEENEQLVKRVLDKTHTHHKLLPFRVNGPVFPVDSESGDATDKFFRLEPSQFTNGCFVARLSRQADPTKVETVQDVLARAAAKGLLGGILPEQLKTGKKGKSRKNRESPSGQERQEGSERDPLAPSEPEQEKGEGGFKGNEEEEEGKREEDEGKRRGVKGRKRKLKKGKKQSNRAPADDKQQPKKKPTKKKGKESHHAKRPTKSKQRRIPRLTLTLMSSEKTSNQLSPMTALAHRLSENPGIRSQQTVSSAPSSAGKHPSPTPTAPSTAPAASRQLQGQNTQPEREEKTFKVGDKSAGLLKAWGKVDAPQEVMKAARGSVLPPIPSPSSGSLRSRTGSSLSHTSHSHPNNMSTSSSSVSLPGL